MWRVFTGGSGGCVRSAATEQRWVCGALSGSPQSTATKNAVRTLCGVESRQRQVRIPLQDTGKPADVAGFHWRKRRVRKERSDGIAIAAPVRQSRQRQVRIPLQDMGKPADVAGFHWRKRRDSNPRGLSPKRFSRPPRYDHFDTLPCAFIVARIVQSFNNMRIIARSCKNRRQSQSHYSGTLIVFTLGRRDFRRGRRRLLRLLRIADAF